MEVIEAGAFNNLDNLHTLCLYDNKLKVINSGIFDGLSSLILLDLHNNDIEQIKSDSFIDLKSLSQLRIQDNRIQHLPSGIFSNLTKLSSLSIQNNELTTLSEDIFSQDKNTQVAISGNPLVCNASLCWLYQAEQDWSITWSWTFGPQCANLPSWSKISIVCGMEDERGKLATHPYNDIIMSIC